LINNRLNIMASEEARALARLMHQVGPAYVRWSQQSIAPDGLSPPRMQVLGHLRERAAPLHALRDCLGSSAANVTKLVDALEADGLVRRRPDANDRRVIQVEITPEGQTVSCGAFDAYLGQVAAVFDTLTVAQREGLTEGLAGLHAALQRNG
jgi:DNA-binding MarR family transcriptional regulator